MAVHVEFSERVRVTQPYAGYPRSPVRFPKDLTVTPPQAMCDPSGPRDKSGGCQRGRSKEKAASSVVSVPHSSPAATIALGYPGKWLGGNFYPWIFSHLGKERDTG